MLGKLSWAAIPFNEPLPLITRRVVGIIILAVLAIITVKGWWPYLWREWLTSVDHKRIGVMYMMLGLVMLLRGFADAIMMRTQQAIAIGDAQGYLPPDHYDQIFSAHGTIMIFFVAMPLVIGLMNFVVPLQLGVRDVAFPVLNSVSFWLTASGALLINMSLVIGNFARTGWMGYPPLSELAFSPDVGVDYYLWSLQISGIGTLLTGINFVTTILKLRAPGHDLFPHAGILLDRAGREHADRRRLPDPDRDLRDAAARSLPRHAFLHQRCRRQPDDVCQPVLGVGPSRSLHPDPAGVRRLLRSGRDLFRQGAVQLPLDGLRDAGDLRPLLHGLAASLLHHGRGRRRQCLLRHHVVDHRGADRRQSLQLAVHDVPWPDRVHDADPVCRSASWSPSSSAA